MRKSGEEEGFKKSIRKGIKWWESMSVKGRDGSLRERSEIFIIVSLIDWWDEVFG